MKHIRTAYLDNDVISVYAAGSRAGKRWFDLEDMLHLTHYRAVSLETSTVTQEEARKGVGGAARQRKGALISLHVRVAKEPAINIRQAEALVATLPGEGNQRLVNDARHLLMAARMGSDVLISFNTADFNYLVSRLKGVRGAPFIVRPEVLASFLAEEIHPKKQSNPPRPVRRGSLRAAVLRRLRELDRRFKTKRG